MHLPVVNIDFVYWPDFGVCSCRCVSVCTESCVCLFVCPCPTSGPLSGCGFPFPVPVSHLGPNSDDICSVFVVDLDKGPYGLGMGLIDGLVSLCSIALTFNSGGHCHIIIRLYLFQNLDSVSQHRLIGKVPLLTFLQSSKTN